MNLPYDTRCSAIVFKSNTATAVFDPNKDISSSCTYSFFQQNNQLGGGFCLFFFGDTQLEAINGSPGPGLGYTSLSGYMLNGLDVYTGVAGAFLGVGFDVDGYFSLSGVNRTGGYYTPQPNTVCIRGGALDQYSLVANSGDLRTNYGITLSCIQNEYKCVRVSLSNFSRNVRVDIKDTNEEFITIIDTPHNLHIPTGYIRCGLTFSTGLSGNSNFWVKSLDFLGSGLTTYTRPITAGSTISPVFTDNTATIQLSGNEQLAQLSTYDVADAYQFEIFDPTLPGYTTTYYTNSAVGVDTFTSTLSAVTQWLSGSAFADLSSGYFNYVRSSTVSVSSIVGETSIVVFSLSALGDSTYPYSKIVFDKYGNGIDLTTHVKDFYLTYNNANAYDIFSQATEFNSPKFDPFVTQYSTISSDFTTLYTPIISAFRDNGVIDVISVNLVIAKESFAGITNHPRLIDSYPVDGNVLLKLQDPGTNQVYFSMLSAG